MGVGENHCCSRCLLDSPAFDTARAAFAFEGGVKELLHSFKYTPRPHLRKPLALLMCGALTGQIELIKPDLIIPVPLHGKKMRQRGFNQAILLGEILSRQWRLPLERAVLQRTRWTEPQVNLSKDDRRINVRGAFAVSNGSLLVDRKVLLLDDVFTTGSTLHECARAVKAVGASQVHAVTVARAV